MYCYFGLTKYIVDKVIVNGVGWIHEEDYDKLCSGIVEAIAYAVGYFFPNNCFMICEVFEKKEQAEEAVHYLNGGNKLF